MSSDADALVEMGFPSNRVQRALHHTGYKGIQQAMDWMLDHANDPGIDEEFEPPKGNVLGDASNDNVNKEPGAEDESGHKESDMDVDPPTEVTDDLPLQAKSLKCDECGKLLRSESEVEVHAARSGHSSFSESTEEIKPLTEEEKKELLAKVQERMKKKREERAEKEKEEAIQREKMRRRTGKELSEARQKLQDEDIKRTAEMKRREKMEERQARQKVLEEIERDKKDRKAKFAKSSGTSQENCEPKTQPPPVAQQPKKDYDKCRIQIRLLSGQTLTETFGAKEQLASVRLFVQMKSADFDGPFVLRTNFPRKLFTEEDMEKPLSELGLVPSAVLIVSKPQ